MQEDILKNEDALEALLEHLGIELPESKRDLFLTFQVSYKVERWPEKHRPRTIKEGHKVLHKTFK